MSVPNSGNPSIFIDISLKPWVMSQKPWVHSITQWVQSMKLWIQSLNPWVMTLKPWVTKFPNLWWILRLFSSSQWPLYPPLGFLYWWFVTPLACIQLMKTWPSGLWNNWICKKHNSFTTFVHNSLTCFSFVYQVTVGCWQPCPVWPCTLRSLWRWCHPTKACPSLMQESFILG